MLTNSLASTDMPIVHAGYRNHRVPLLEMGVELYEVAPEARGAGHRPRAAAKSASSGVFALHAKVFVFDRERVFVGSMNFDQRSLRVNTELGFIIDSREIAQRSPRASMRSRSQPTAIRSFLTPANLVRVPVHPVAWCRQKRECRDARQRARGQAP